MSELSAPENLELCLHGGSAPCMCTCWFDLDVRDMVSKIRRGSFGTAFSLYRNAVVFPGLVAKICGEPCRGGCGAVHKEPVSLRLLEQAVVDFGMREPVDYNMSVKNERVIVVGAGGAGLACAQRFASKGWPVTVYEKEETVGGRLRTAVDAAFLADELERDFRYLPCEIRTGVTVSSMEQLDAAVIFVSCDDERLHSERSNVFFSKDYVAHDHPAASIAGGLRAAADMEAYLTSGGTQKTADRKNTGHTLPAARESESEAVRPGGERYTKAEAREEASRCLKCDCTRCYDRCDMMQYYKAYPAKLVQEVDATFHPDPFSPLNRSRMVSSCTLCGNCTESCPSRIDMEAYFLAARRELSRAQKISPAYSEFWVRDMEHADASGVKIVQAPGDGCRYAFFPGCQMSAAEPELIGKVMDYLRQAESGMGLLLRCCGAPALWSGRDETIRKVQAELHEDWEQMGRPILLTACPSCRKTLQRLMPEAECQSIYRFIRERELPVPETDREYMLFDPCSAKEDFRADVRALLRGKMSFSEPPEKERGSCCGYGGGIDYANRELAAQIRDKRTKLSELPYITYCVNCRDIFLQGGKETLHMLEWLTDTPERTTVDGINARRENREALAKEWNTARPDAAGLPEVEIPEELMAQLDRERLLADDVRAAIARCEETNNVIERADGSCIGHWGFGCVTYWVIYTGANGRYRLLGVYSHRLRIEDENHEC